MLIPEISKVIRYKYDYKIGNIDVLFNNEIDGVRYTYRNNKTSKRTIYMGYMTPEEYNHWKYLYIINEIKNNFTNSICTTFGDIYTPLVLGVDDEGVYFQIIDNRIKCLTQDITNVIHEDYMLWKQYKDQYNH